MSPHEGRGGICAFEERCVEQPFSLSWVPGSRTRVGSSPPGRTTRTGLSLVLVVGRRGSFHRARTTACPRHRDRPTPRPSSGNWLSYSDSDAAARERIAYWDAGSPGYRWLEVISSKVLAGQPATAYPHRVYTYIALAIYNATIATWESKYHYKRDRPGAHGRPLTTELPTPDSPSYPSEHAAAAQAAAAVLAYFFPDEAARISRWPRRPAGRACWRACNTQATTTPA